MQQFNNTKTKLTKLKLLQTSQIIRKIKSLQTPVKKQP